MEIAGFLGAVLEPGDERFETARQIWNGDIQRRPAVIARCTGTADVLAAVRFARERELPIAIRGGGHAVAGHAVCDGGLMIDLSASATSRTVPVRHGDLSTTNGSTRRQPPGPVRRQAGRRRGSVRDGCGA